MLIFNNLLAFQGKIRVDKSDPSRESNPDPFEDDLAPHDGSVNALVIDSRTRYIVAGMIMRLYCIVLVSFLPFLSFLSLNCFFPQPLPPLLPSCPFVSFLSSSLPLRIVIIILRYLLSGDSGGEIFIWRTDSTGWYELLRRLKRDVPPTIDSKPVSFRDTLGQSLGRSSILGVSAAMNRSTAGAVNRSMTGLKAGSVSVGSNGAACPVVERACVRGAAGEPSITLIYLTF